MKERAAMVVAYLVLYLLGMLVLSSCGVETQQENRLLVFAAASLTDVLQEIGDGFQAEADGVESAFNFAGSQELAQQLAAGAPGDVFASANSQQMDAVVESGRIAPEDVQVFAHNTLVVVYPADNPGQVQSLADLARPGLRLVLAASEVPAGRYTLAFLERATTDGRFGTDYEEKVLANVSSYEQNVRAVLTKVILGEADAGIVYRSDVQSAGTENVEQMMISEELNVSAAYYVAPLQDSTRLSQGQAFIGYLLSRPAQCLLQEYGLTIMENLESPCQS